MEFNTQLIEDIRTKIKSLSNRNEDNIKHHIVVDVFLERMGYPRSMCNFEENCKNDFADIYINIPENQSLYVEVKNGYNDLKEEDIDQLCQYITNMKEAPILHSY